MPEFLALILGVLLLAVDFAAGYRIARHYWLVRMTKALDGVTRINLELQAEVARFHVRMLALHEYDGRPVRGGR